MSKVKEKLREVDAIPLTPSVKIMHWKDIHEEKRNDINFLRAMKKKYEDNFDDLSTNTDYRSVANRLYKLDQQEAKKISTIEKQFNTADRDGEEFDEVLMERTADWLELEDYYYSREENRFFRREVDGGVIHLIRWYPCTGVMKGLFDNKKANDALWAQMHNTGRMKDKVINTTGKVDSTVFNALSQERWLKPAQVGKKDDWLDVLIYSLANGDEEIQEYIEYCIAFKYLHPGETRIPVLWFYGEGGAGKNVLVEKVLATIFSPMCVTSVGSSVLTGFNGELLGKTVVLLDETKIDKKMFNEFKRYVWNPTTPINRKFGQAGSYENTIMWIAGGNGFDAAPPLAGDSSDRRWSPIRIDHNIMDRVKEKFGVEYDRLNRSGPAVDLYDNNEWRFTDEKIVSEWLKYIIDKHGHKTRPHPLMNDDIIEITRAHEPQYVQFFREVFEVDEMGMFMVFKEGATVTTRDLYDLYLERYPSERVIKEIRFAKELSDWTRFGNVKIFKVKVRIDVKDGRVRQTSGYSTRDSQVLKMTDVELKTARRDIARMLGMSVLPVLK